MTFPTGGVENMKYSDEELKAMLAKSREASKHPRKLGRVMEIVADHRLQQLKHFPAREQLATWRRAHGYDRITGDDKQWASRPLPLTPEQVTQSLWSELKALRDAISMPKGDGFSQRTKSFIKEIGQGTVNSTDAIGQSTANLTDAEFVMLKRLVEKRDRDAAHATAAPADTAQYRSPNSPNHEIPSYVCVCIGGKEAGMVDPEQDQLDPPSAGTGLETPGQQCPPNGETGRTTADGCLLVGVGSNSGGKRFFPSEIAVGTRSNSKTTNTSAASNIIILQQGRQPRDKTSSEENKQFDLGGKGEKPLP